MKRPNKLKVDRWKDKGNEGANYIMNEGFDTWQTYYGGGYRTYKDMELYEYKEKDFGTRGWFTKEPFKLFSKTLKGLESKIDERLQQNSVRFIKE